MARNLNLANIARWIHWAPPGDLDGVFQAAMAKLAELGLKIGRRSHVTPANIPGDPSVNVRGVLQFIEACEPHVEKSDDHPGDSAAEKAAKTEDHNKLIALCATLQTRLNAAGYTPPAAEATPEPPPVPATSPNPKPLA